MKLIPEQVKYLRERKNELLRKKQEFRTYCQSRDLIASDWLSISPMSDYQEELKMSRVLKEIDSINKTLSDGDYVKDRSFDKIDVGTKFTIQFDDEEDEDSLILTENNGFSSKDYSFVSLDSDLGKAVYGKKKGDHVTYSVKSTGGKFTVTIKDIENMKEKYEHYICDTEYSRRGSSCQRMKQAKLERMGDVDSKAITSSQLELLEEEIARLSHGKPTTSSIAKKAYLNKILRNSTIASPKGDTIGIGSHVGVMIQDHGKLKDMEFELINRAYTTELASQYVEKISALGNAIYGLKKGEVFQLRIMGQPSISGIVTYVQNEEEMKRVY